MSAWGLERAGSKGRQENEVANIAHAEELLLDLSSCSTAPEQDYFQCQSFASDHGTFDFLFHFFDGRLEWFTGEPDRLFDPSPAPNSFKLQAVLTGHAEPIEFIIISANENTVISVSSGHEAIAWTLDHESEVLTKKSFFDFSEGPATSGRIVMDLSIVAFVHQGKVSIWNFDHFAASQVAQCPIETTEFNPLIVISDGDDMGYDDFQHLALVSHQVELPVWQLFMDRENDEDAYRLHRVQKSHHVSSLEFQEAASETGQRSTRTISLVQYSNGSDFALKNALVSCESTGKMTFWRRGHGHTYREISSVETSLDHCSIVEACGLAFIGAADRSRNFVSIWNFLLGKHEYTIRFRPHETTQSFKWRQTAHGSAIAVALTHSVKIYAQSRYDHRAFQDPWLLAKEIDIYDLTTLQIADITWTVGEHLILAAGNQMFLSDCRTSISPEIMRQNGFHSSKAIECELPEALCLFNKRLPEFHPCNVSYLYLSGCIYETYWLLILFHEKLRFMTDEGELAYLSENRLIESSISTLVAHHESEGSTIEFGEDTVRDLTERLSTSSIPFLSGSSKRDLTTLVFAAAEVHKEIGGTDDCGLRYMLFLQTHLSSHNDGKNICTIPWRDILWAYHSSSQDRLIDFTARQYSGRVTWQNARESGMLLWLQDVEAVVGQHKQTITLDCK